eukprot:TRINITY_DN9952_c0_g1_i1.p1 TRINITY_DN9952_c0_g1~~TRINITY_DN9952_c0_g1_i1.p1  ORF type:complete len:639 (-),score=161.48 TRINITY_DN9952_c0_g1_i1:1549-3465(-)
MELNSAFSKQLKDRTSEYYSEVNRLCESITVLTEDSYGIERKREEMGRVCSVFYGGSVECARAALDLRITRYLHLCLQSGDGELRNYSLLVVLQLAKAVAGKIEESETEEEVIEDKLLLDYIHGEAVINNPADMKRFIKLARTLPTVYFEQNRKIFKALGASLQSPVHTSILTKLLKDPLETTDNKLLIIKIIFYLYTAGPMFIQSLNSPLTEAYLTLAKLLKSRKNPSDELGKEIRAMFVRLIELRDTVVDGFLKANKAARDLLKECGIDIPAARSFQPVLEAFQNLWTAPSPDEKSLVTKQRIPTLCKDLRPFLMSPKEHQQAEDWDSFLRMVMDVLSRSAEISWDAFKQSRFKEQHREILKAVIGVWELLVRKEKYRVVLEAKSGKLLHWMLSKITQVLTEVSGGKENELLPFTLPMQKVFALLLKADNALVNEALESLKFGQVLGQHLQLQYESLKQSMKAQLCNTYPAQNNIRLCLFKHLLRSSSEKFHSQFLKSRFIERMAADYIKNLQRFKTSFSKIDLKFLAFRHCYPLRNESIEFVREVLETKGVLRAELVQRINVHLLVPHECQIVEAYESKPEYLVLTSLLLLTIIVREIPEVGEKDERVKAAVREVLSKRPTLKRQFSELASKLKA